MKFNYQNASYKQPNISIFTLSQHTKLSMSLWLWLLFPAQFFSGLICVSYNYDPLAQKKYM